MYLSRTRLKILLFLSVQKVHQMTMGIVPQSLCVFYWDYLFYNYVRNPVWLWSYYCRTCSKWQTTCFKYDKLSYRLSQGSIHKRNSHYIIAFLLYQTLIKWGIASLAISQVKQETFQGCLLVTCAKSFPKTKDQCWKKSMTCNREHRRFHLNGTFI